MSNSPISTGYLVDQLIALYNAAILAGSVDAKRVFKGVYADPSLIDNDSFPYIAIDDGGETSKLSESQNTLERNFAIKIEMAVRVQDRELALTNLLLLNDQVKAIFDGPAGRFADGRTWSTNTQTFAWEDAPYFYRGRQVTVEYKEYLLDYLDY
jgi:hypothetical protein